LTVYPIVDIISKQFMEVRRSRYFVSVHICTIGIWHYFEYQIYLF